MLKKQPIVRLPRTIGQAILQRKTFMIGKYGLRNTLILKSPDLSWAYTRGNFFWFDGDAPKVYLFADNIEACASKKGYSEEHVFGFVFIHEMMHAYYDAFNSAGFPAKEPLEEAFAEYGMLTFINKTIGPGVFLEEAKASVFSKIDYGPREYGFGYELFADTSGGAPEMIERYRLVSNWIDYPTVSRFAKDYFKCIEDYKKSIDEKTASDCIEGVRYILEHEWPEPDAGYIIQPGIGKKVPALSLSGISSAVPPTGLAGSKISVPKSRHYFDIIERKTGTYIAVQALGRFLRGQPRLWPRDGKMRLPRHWRGELAEPTV